jgi:dsRNA-specific ribonuclease
MAGINGAEKVLQDAWIGDAVLSLWARLRILREDNKLDGAKAVRMTSNQFLSATGEPSRVEAEIGQVYLRDGLDAAFAWIEEKLLPVFERQEENRKKKKTTGRRVSAQRGPRTLW